MITIISTITTHDIDGNEDGRHCDIIVADQEEFYQLSVGGLPLEGGLQAFLDDRHPELLKAAIKRGHVKTATEVRYLLYATAWSNEAFQAAIIENVAENVGGSMPGFADILELFEQINDEWPIA